MSCFSDWLTGAELQRSSGPFTETQAPLVATQLYCMLEERVSSVVLLFHPIDSDYKREQGWQEGVLYLD